MAERSRDAQVLGYVCGTLSPQTQLTHESMAQHHADGITLCIHSVCVDSLERRKGIGLGMLRAYVNMVRLARTKLQSIRLICKQQLVHFYELAGFAVVGPSPVVHGQDTWIECAMEL